MSWGSGYVTDVAYLPGYYRQQSPADLAVACLLGNVRSDIPALYEAMSYLELGCGRGLSALVLAASNPGWHVTGIDFNPAHIAEARQLAASAGLSNVTFHEVDLASLTSDAASPIPQADVVSMHGVWSWVAPPVQDGIVRLLAAKLRAGGVLHISYNSLPGWQAGFGIQRLLHEAGSRLAFRSDRQVSAALDVVKQLHEAGARHLTAAPLGDDPVARLTKMPSEYLAHEYMNAFWRPVFHADVVAALRPAKLEWVAAADLLENFPALMLTEAQRAVQERFDDPLMRELIKDMCHPRSLRHDVFVRGPRRITNAERDVALRELTLALTVRPDDFVYEAAVPAGKATLGRAFYEPVVAALGREAHLVSELLALPDLHGQRDIAAELVGMLLGTGQAVVVARPGAAPERTAQRFNHTLARSLLRGGSNAGGAAMASFRLGAGLAAIPAELLTLDMLMEGGEASPEAWAVQAGMATDTAVQFRSASETLLERRSPVWRLAGLC
ncbi:MAG: class I SAM-dependent methyltransferase [Acetobacteraceae bacterium]|nr:class I SAM-dependent methyltransferase [Acetobacteraceae bacterium]